MLPPISSLLPLPSADVLRAQFVGLPISALPTPCVLIDRARIAYNCEQMRSTVDRLACRFRAHVKTLKTAESTLLQVKGLKDKAIIVSTLAEAWGVVQSGLIRQGKVREILYGVPIGVHRVAEFVELRAIVQQHAQDADVSVIVDNAAQVEALQTAVQAAGAAPVDVFVKIECGYRRAGLSIESPLLPLLVQQLASASHLRIVGVYCHAGFSYGSKTVAEASSYLSQEMQTVNQAAQIVQQIAKTLKAPIRQPLILSVGSTPTAHAAAAAAADAENSDMQRIKAELIGELELHAGNYPVLDLQQVATNAIPDVERAAIDRCALSVLSTVISSYPGRALKGNAQPPHADGLARFGDEALIDAGGIALSKDVGPIAGHGHVVWPERYTGWEVGRVAQEHGVLTVRKGGVEQCSSKTTGIRVGDKIRIVPQHACMTAAAHPWFFVYDSLKKEALVEDVWVPWKGW